MMKTYSKISLAFENGSGDVFYSNGDRTQFFAISRHIAGFSSEGFNRLTYDEIINIAKSQSENDIAFHQNILNSNFKSQINMAPQHGINSIGKRYLNKCTLDYMHGDDSASGIENFYTGL